MWAERISSEDAKTFGGAIALQGNFSPDRVDISEIIDIQAPPPRIANAAAKLALESTDPNPPAQSRPVARSAWIWSPAVWIDTPEKIWAMQSRHKLEAVYLTLPTEAGQVRNIDLLSTFVTEARRRGLAVWSVSGDPGDVLEANRSALLSRLAAYADYNRRVAAGARLAGVQLDIEPYLIPGYRLSPAAWRERYLATVRMARTALPASTRLDLAMPYWWARHKDWGDTLLDALASLDIGITVMNYRTDLDALLDGARPFLEWSQRYGKPVNIGLELGPIPDETRRHYRGSADGGELWLLPLGGHPALMLLSAPTDGLPGKAFRYTHATDAPATVITFAGNLARLDAMTEKLLPVWSAWPNFVGLTLHGLDAIDSNSRLGD
ncbi:MAG TPA: hypothetical protein VJ001_10570 [Rhodocyclaceae bacterium]|nr:hypothetical protein [Rhodocyclaceae bacterium]